MIIFPTIVYKSPGQHFGPFGKTYKTAPAVDQSVFDALIADGWHATLPEACGQVVDKEPEPDLLSPPTRAELEAKATELGLKFDGRTRDGKLTAMISEAIEAQKVS